MSRAFDLHEMQMERPSGRPVGRMTAHPMVNVYRERRNLALQWPIECGWQRGYARTTGIWIVLRWPIKWTDWVEIDRVAA